MGGRSPCRQPLLYVRPLCLKFARRVCSRDGGRIWVPETDGIDGTATGVAALAPICIPNAAQAQPALLVPACRDPPPHPKASIPTTPLSAEQRGPGGNQPSSTRSTRSPSSILTGMVSVTSVVSIRNSTISEIWVLISSGCRPYTSPR